MQLEITRSFPLTTDEKRRWSNVQKVFLRLLVVASLTLLPELPDTNGNTVAGSLFTFTVSALTQLSEQEAVQTVEHNVQEITGDTMNASYRSRLEVIQSAIVQYQSSHPDKRVHWEKEPVYASDMKAISILLHSNSMRGLIEPEHREALFMTALEQQYDSQEIPAPLSEAEVLSYFLDISDGDMAEALSNMTGFLKYMIRGIAPAYDTSQVEWVRVHILDQINLHFSYNNFASLDHLSHEDRELLINLLGELYHVYALYALLSSQSPQIIAMGVRQNYDLLTSAISRYKFTIDSIAVGQLGETLALLGDQY